MRKEIEIAFNNINENEVRKKLEFIGLINSKPRTFMKRKAFHFDKDIEDGRKRWARVRDEGDKITMTMKEVLGCGINDICEAEVVIDSFNGGIELLKMFGMKEVAYQESYREEWVDADKKVFITIDEWPFLKPLIEIEGKSEEVVREYVEMLGFEFNKGFIGDVSMLYSAQYNIPREYFLNIPKIKFDMSLEEFLGREFNK